MDLEDAYLWEETEADKDRLAAYRINTKVPFANSAVFPFS
jgi:hypothetical protein